MTDTQITAFRTVPPSPTAYAPLDTEHPCEPRRLLDGRRRWRWSRRAPSGSAHRFDLSRIRLRPTAADEDVVVARVDRCVAQLRPEAHLVVRRVAAGVLRPGTRVGEVKGLSILWPHVDHLCWKEIV